MKPAGLIAGSAFTAILLGLAAQQTLGNLSARLVLVSPRPFRVGECIRLQAGALEAAGPESTRTADGTPLLEIVEIRRRRSDDGAPRRSG
ncbi:MAG TPA: mechanosensitive ion channel family protein [Solirubrobacteraceae bacterium]|nr:mechanosensitive ion channel family protein [Solirubrobacteraceae bacterium]